MDLLTVSFWLTQVTCGIPVAFLSKCYFNLYYLLKKLSVSLDGIIAKIFPDSVPSYFILTIFTSYAYRIFPLAQIPRKIKNPKFEPGFLELFAWGPFKTLSID